MSIDIKSWLLAIRPRTLPASASPVLVGTAAAAADQSMRLLPALAALIGAILLQIGVNLANDYFDYCKGVDTAERVGPVRVTQSGLIPPAEVLKGMILIFILAMTAGIYLVSEAGWIVALIGGASILAALLYSGGPFPLASHGLGDVFVFIFFGPVAVCGTYYVQSLRLSLSCALLSIPLGLLIASILIVNNLRDIPTDLKVGKRTLAVILGARGARGEFALLLIMAYAAPVLMAAFGILPVWALLPLLSVPRAVRLVRSLRVLSGSRLNESLADTAKLTLIFSLLLCLGLLIPLAV
ncbi:MAG: 1,4-dihydroxy-2-naphthoate polyprenyltransferase [Desulfobacterales bacterium]|nr:1,4-dihydroxy-2-naphthoate polyprenyltransferase [Desulfobacterales bacterium]